jgi:hypothetical protein
LFQRLRLAVCHYVIAAPQLRMPYAAGATFADITPPFLRYARYIVFAILLRGLLIEQSMF